MDTILLGMVFIPEETAFISEETPAVSPEMRIILGETAVLSGGMVTIYREIEAISRGTAIIPERAAVLE
jgi:hypothetical protein